MHIVLNVITNKTFPPCNQEFGHDIEKPQGGGGGGILLCHDNSSNDRHSSLFFKRKTNPIGAQNQYWFERDSVTRFFSVGY